MSGGRTGACAERSALAIGDSLPLFLDSYLFLDLCGLNQHSSPIGVGGGGGFIILEIGFIYMVI